MISTENLEEPLRKLLDDYLKKQNRPDPENDYLDKIKGYLDNGEMALCVGAGVTRDFVGDWRELLNKLLFLRCCSTFQKMEQTQLEAGGKTLSKDKAKLVDIKSYINKLKNPFVSSGTNPLEIGEYLMYDSDDTSPFIGAKNENVYREIFFAEQVRHVIVSSIKQKIGTYTLEDYFMKKYKEESSLTAIVKLCLKRKITNIITYNFDTILDRLLASPEVRKSFSVEDDVIIHVHSYHKAEPILVLGEGKDYDYKINIYHVHGIVDEDIEETEPIIFSENSYQSYQKTSLNWSNIRLADTMSRFHMLCIGFSGDDANFRMLRHFLTEREDNPVMGTRGDKKELFLMRSFDNDIKNLADPDMANLHPECAFACVKTYIDIVSAYFKVQLGTHIVWSDGFEEMAKQVKMLCEK